MEGPANTRNLAEIMRDEVVLKDKILSLIQESPKTIPEIAEALGSPCHEATLWVMGLWKYGYLSETEIPNEEGYYRYQPKE